MELQSEEGDEMPLPLNSTYGGMIHHHHHSPPPSSISHNHIIIPASSAPPPPPSGPLIIADEALPPPQPFKKISIKYRECLKNHAAGMGGNATDGCGEFMPSGDDGTLEALTCSACGCHRNFHRKEIDGYDSSCFHNPRIGRKLFVGHHHHKGGGGGGGYPDSIGYHISSRAVPPPPPPPPHQMIMSYGMVGGGGGGGSLPSDDQSDEQEMMVRAPQMLKKRFRTKFSQEQKEKMLNFAERVGWKIQKQEEGVVQQFCQEIGVKRRVLKVWMHNNKHTLAKKTTATSIQSSHDHHPIPQHEEVDHTTQSLGTN